VQEEACNRIPEEERPDMPLFPAPVSVDPSTSIIEEMHDDECFILTVTTIATA
jgi:hypothetical protein